MKVSAIMPFMAIVALLNLTSCSTESFPEEAIDNITIQNPPAAKQIEIEIMELINQHRLEIGLNPLNHHDTVKAVAFTHTDYMIEVDNVSHDNFYQRKQSLQAHASANLVSENVAYGFNSAHSVVTAWLNSDSHKDNIEGNYTDFDISAEQNDAGKWYFTNIFIKR